MGKKLTKKEHRARIDERYPGITRLLGKVPDSLLARRYGVTTPNILYMRRQMDISSFSSLAPQHLKRFFRHLGKKSDGDLAKLCGVSAGTVYNWRRKLSIPSHRDFMNNKYRKAGRISRQGITYLILAGFSDVDIAWRVNSTPGNIAQIRRNEIHFRRIGTGGRGRRSGTYSIAA